MSDCKFCQLANEAPEFSRYGTVYAVLDGYPVTSGHWLVIPFRHSDDYFEMTERELEDTSYALSDLRGDLLYADATITGFNIGWNCGTDAGQTVMHAHAHLIPRRNGDHAAPAGGVRSVIPGKQHYSTGATA